MGEMTRCYPGLSSIKHLGVLCAVPEISIPNLRKVIGNF